jgi:cold shock CspA family protein
MKGRVISLHDSFGFISNDQGVQYYFNRHSFIGRSEFSMLQYGSEVDFKPKESPFGWRAHYVSIKNKPPFAWEEGAIYVEHACNYVLKWWKDYPARFKTEHRVLTSTEFVTDFYPVREEARDIFYYQIGVSGANFIQDVEIETTVRLVQGHASTLYRYRATIGIYLKAKKVKSAEEEAYFTAVFQEGIEQRLESFSAFSTHAHPLAAEAEPVRKVA